VILAVTVDPREDLNKIFGKVSGEGAHPNIVLLSDPGHKVIDRYGLLNPQSRGLPHPATFVIDKDGIVRWRVVDVDYRERPDNDQILKALRSLNAP
jgi:peroxiredoxin